MTIRRVDRGRNHWYEDTDTGARVPGVTKLTDGGLPKPALINWAANATAEFAVDHWDRLADLAPSARLKERAGWVRLHKHTTGARQWKLTAAGRAILDQHPEVTP